jgi:hypothetical protein
MSNQINYKQKYQELKMKFMEAVDTAFALGFEQGQVQAQQDQMMQQQQQQLEAQQNAQQGGFGEGHGAEGSPAGAEQQANPNGGEMPQEPDSQNPAGSELDQHIEKLESMVSKSEVSPAELMGFLNDLRKSQADAQQAAELKKSSLAIKGIAKALHKPAFKIGQQASHNMNSNAKAAVTMQHKIVNDIMKAWDDESNKASKDIKSVLDLSNLTKKD